MKKALILIICGILAIACGNTETSKAENNHTEALNTEKAAVPATTEKASSPCGFVTEAKIKEVLGLPADAVTDMRDVMRTYPTCFYKWESVIFTRKQMISGRELDLEYPAEVVIVLVKHASSQMFDTSTTVYKDGETQDGIGEMAIWGSQMSQLTFLAKGTMIHLNVKVSGDAADNKAKAVELAGLIFDKL